MKVILTEGFKKDMERLFSKDLKWRIYRFFQWVIRIPKEIKWFWQRGVRGYSDQDTWNIYSYILGWLPNALRSLNKGKFGCPGCMSFKQWTKILREMEKGLRKWDEDAIGERGKKNAEEVEKALKLFTRYFFHLWD